MVSLVFFLEALDKDGNDCDGTWMKPWTIALNVQFVSKGPHRLVSSPQVMVHTCPVRGLWSPHLSLPFPPGCRSLPAGHVPQASHCCLCVDTARIQLITFLIKEFLSNFPIFTLTFYLYIN